ncbi:polysaccharide deacetylase family protein [Streptomyces sp. NPDC004647]|uniref:polysaccharide deacetylase family protein n=1 Tax=Streptomyces sp. NPDC004647 TaxID=3154671 RepID=UPI0033A39742
MTGTPAGAGVIAARRPRAFSRLSVGAVAAAAMVGAVALPASGHTPVPGPLATSAVTDSGTAQQPVRSTAAGPVEDLFGSEIRKIPTTERVVALTFNAAWDGAGVDTVLSVLRERKVPATFFLTGKFADTHPEVARAMAAEHGIGNHSYNHPSFDDLTSQEAEDEVLRTDRAIRAATGAEPAPFFRFPYGATTPQGIAGVNALGFADIEFTADTNGYLGTAGGMTVQKVVTRAMDALTPGEIVQMHVGTPDGGGTVLDAEALPEIIDAIHDRGYRIIDLRSLVDTETE